MSGQRGLGAPQGRSRMDATSLPVLGGRAPREAGETVLTMSGASDEASVESNPVTTPAPPPLKAAADPANGPGKPTVGAGNEGRDADGLVRPAPPLDFAVSFPRL